MRFWPAHSLLIWLVVALSASSASAQQIAAFEPFPYWGYPQGHDVLALEGGDVVALIPTKSGTNAQSDPARPFLLERRGADLKVKWSQPVPIEFSAGTQSIFNAASLQMTWMQLYQTESELVVFEARDDKIWAHGFDPETGAPNPVREVGPIESVEPGKKRFAFKTHYSPPAVPHRAGVPFQMSPDRSMFATAHAPDAGAVVFRVYDQRLKERKRLTVEVEDLEMPGRLFLENDGRLLISQYGENGSVNLTQQPLRGRASTVEIKHTQPHIFSLGVVGADKNAAYVMVVTGEKKRKPSKLEVSRVDFKTKKVTFQRVWDDATLKPLLSPEAQQLYLPFKSANAEFIEPMLTPSGELLMTLRGKYSITTVTTETNTQTGATSTSSSTEWRAERSLMLSMRPDGTLHWATILPDLVQSKSPIELEDLRLVNGQRMRVLWRGAEFSWTRGVSASIRYADLDLATGKVDGPHMVFPEVRSGEVFLPQLSVPVSMDEWVLASRAIVFGLGAKQASNTILTRALPTAPLLPGRAPAPAKGAAQSHPDRQLGEVIGRMAFRTDGMTDLYRGLGVGAAAGFVGGYAAFKMQASADPAISDRAGTMVWLSLISGPIIARNVGAHPDSDWWTLQSPEFQAGYLKYQTTKRRKRAMWSSLLGTLVGMTFAVGAAN